MGTVSIVVIVGLLFAQQSLCLSNASPIHPQQTVNRIRRDASVFIDFVDKLSNITVALNGIALEAGILDGSIPFGKAVGALLRMDADSDFEDFGRIDTAQLIPSLSALDSLRNSTLNQNANTGPLEDWIRTIMTANENWMKFDFKKFPDAAALDKFDVLNNIDNYISDLVNFDTANAVNVVQNQETGSYSTVLGELQKFVTAVEEIKKRVNATELIEILNNLQLEILKNSFSAYDIVSNNDQSQLRELNQLFANLATIKPAADFSVIGSFLTALRSGVSSDLIPAFKEGLDDLKKVSGIAKQTWFKQLINSKINLDGLNQLDTLHGKLNDLKTNWKAALPPAVVSNFNLGRVTEVGGYARKATGAEQVLDSTINTINTNCFSRILKSDVKENTSDASTNEKNLMDKLDYLNSVLKLNTEKIIEDFNGLPGVNRNEKAEKVLYFLGKVHVSPLADLKNRTKDFNAYGNFLKNFRTEAKDYLEKMDCFNKSYENIEKINNGIKALDTFRRWPFNFTEIRFQMQQILPVLDNSANLIQAVLQLKSSIVATATGMQNLKEMSGILKDIQPMVDAFDHFKKIKTVVMHEADLEIVKTHAPLYDQLMSPAPPGFNDISTQLPPFLNNLKQKTESCVMPTTSLGDISPLILQLKGIWNLRYYFTSFTAAVRAASRRPEANPEFKTLNESWHRLASVEGDLGSISERENLLDEMSIALKHASFPLKGEDDQSSPNGNGNGQNDISGSGGSGKASGALRGGEEDEDGYILYICIGGGVLLLLGLAGFGGFLMYKKKKKDSKKSKNGKSTSGSESKETAESPGGGPKGFKKKFKFGGKNKSKDGSKEGSKETTANKSASVEPSGQSAAAQSSVQPSAQPDVQFAEPLPPSPAV